MTRILLVEDDESLGRTLHERLERERYRVEWTRSVAEARAALFCETWHLAIVDVRLPDGSGFALARRIRASTSTALMFMTALNSVENRVEGYEIGADDYLPKPFHLKELLLRVRRLLTPRHPHDQLTVAGRVINFRALTIDACGRRTFLPVRDRRVLELLIESAPRVVTRAEILDRVWGADRFPTTRAVDNAIVRLRRALADADGRMIRSLRGIGYQWAAGREDA